MSVNLYASVIEYCSSVLLAALFQTLPFPKFTAVMHINSCYSITVAKPTEDTGMTPEKVGRSGVSLLLNGHQSHHRSVSHT